MATIQTNLTCELQNGSVAVQYLNGVLFSQDNQANQINVAVYDGGEPATISGTVTANIIRADGGTVTATGGSISGNVASIAMPSAAYAVPGVASIIVKLSTDGVVTTIAAVVANIYESSTATAIDPGTIIPSVTALVSQINTAVASIPADYSALWTTLAPAFSTSATYTPGQYVTYNGGLYRFTNSHTGAWSSSDVVAANIGNDLSDLKSAIPVIAEYAYNGFSELTSSDVESGGITAEGANTPNTARLRTINRIPVKKGFVIKFFAGTEITNIFWYLYKNGVFDHQGTSWLNSGDSINVTEDGEYRFSFKSGSAGTTEITPTDFDATVKINGNIVNDIGNTTGELLVWLGSKIYVDTTAKTLTITPGYIIVRYGINRVKIVSASQNIVVNGAFHLLQNLYFNLDTNTFQFINSGTDNDVSRNASAIDLGHFYGTDIHLNCFPGYYLDGVWVNNTDYHTSSQKFTKIGILGDSISTYSGYSETGYAGVYYPRGDVTSVNDTWWKIVATGLCVSNISVSAISSSAYYDYDNAQYPPMYDSTRIARIGQGGNPDLIFVNAGTNDGFVAQSANIAYSEDISTLEALPNSTVKGIALTIRKLQASYPSAKIVVLIPKQVDISEMVSGYGLERITKIADEIKAYAEMFGVWKVIDLRKCGINQDNIASYCEDNVLHPNKAGMKAMAEYILQEMM